MQRDHLQPDASLSAVSRTPVSGWYCAPCSTASSAQSSFPRIAAGEPPRQRHRHKVLTARRWSRCLSGRRPGIYTQSIYFASDLCVLPLICFAVAGTGRRAFVFWACRCWPIARDRHPPGGRRPRDLPDGYDLRCSSPSGTRMLPSSTSTPRSPRPNASSARLHGGLCVCRREHRRVRVLDAGLWSRRVPALPDAVDRSRRPSAASCSRRLSTAYRVAAVLLHLSFSRRRSEVF